jgi:hypothetical protein
MLASIALSAWCLYVVSRLDRENGKTFAADKISVALVAIGILWLVFLGLSTYGKSQMKRVIGIVDKVEDGRAQISFADAQFRYGYEVLEFDNLIMLHEGDSLRLLSARKTLEVASRTWIFTFLGFATGLFLVGGALLAKSRRRLVGLCAPAPLP